MSEYICSLTNQPTNNPVVSSKSGHIFDKDAIENYLGGDSVCPITNKPLTSADLIPLHVNKPTKEKLKSEAGISSIVNIFKNEWDAAMLESFTLKQNLDTVRKELSHALYQYDAACRTIARLIKEKEEAKNSYKDLVAQKNQANQSRVSTTGQGAKEFPEKMIRDIYDLRIDLSNMRKEFEKNEQVLLSYSSQEMILNYKLTNSVALHSEKVPGITCLDINTELDDLILTGGNDGTVVLYNKAQDKIINTFEKHTKPITGVKFALGRTRAGRQVVGISSSEDGWGYGFIHNYDDSQVKEFYKYGNHKAGLTGCAVHPINYLGIFSSRDGSFSCHDLAQGALLSHVTLDKNVPITTMGIHPDGEIAVFAGEDGSLRVWNVPQLVEIGKIQAHNGAINSLSLSEDGKFLATSSFQEKMVKLWDLRKLGDDTYRILNDGVEGVVNFDRSGRYIGIGAGSSLQLYNVRTMDQFTKISAHQERITSIQFGNYSKYIATASLDRHLKIFS